MTAPVRPPGREVLHCTCALGECKRPGHRPLSAQCGHPGVFAHVNGRSVCTSPNCAIAAILARPFPSQEAIGRAIGAFTGAAGRKGGWIYNADGMALTQGWASYAHRMAGVVRLTDDGRSASGFDFEPGKGYRIREEGLRRVANHLARLEARSNL